MAIINLRDYYPFYTSDCFMEVSEEVAEMFKEFDRKEAAYRLRTYFIWLKRICSRYGGDDWTYKTPPVVLLDGVVLVILNF